MNELQIPIEIKKKVDRELDPEEEIKWIDQPIPQFFTMYSLLIFLSAIPLTSFAIVWILGALELTSFSDSEKDSQIPFFMNFFPLFGLLPLAMGIAMLSAPFWEWRRKRNTVYLITNQRAIAIEGGNPLSWIVRIGNQSQTIKSFSPEQLNSIYRREKTDSAGDVIFAIRGRTNSKGYSYNQEIGFFGVRHAKEVENLLKELAENPS